MLSRVKYANRESKGNQEMRNNTDGVARIRINSDRPVPTQHGLTYVTTGGGSKNNSLHRIFKYGRRPATAGDRGALQMNYHPALKSHRSRSNSPPRRHNAHHVEEEFRFVPMEVNNTFTLPRKGQKGRQLVQLRDQTDIGHGGRMVRPASEDITGKRRQGLYRSISEFEEAQRNMTARSSGLHTTSSSGNIVPQMSLVMRGNNYSIESANTRNQARFVQPVLARPRVSQTNVERRGLRQIEGGRFPVVSMEQSPNLRSARRNRVNVLPNMYRQPQQLAPDPQEITQQIQPYSPSSSGPIPK